MQQSPRSAAAGPSLVVLAAVLAASALAQVLRVPALGLDFAPLRNAAEALLAGDSVFGDPHFVYPPTAAVLLLPTTAGSPYTASALWIAAGAGSLVLAACLAGRQAAPGHRSLITGVALAGLLGGVAADRCLALGNLTAFLAPVAVAVLLLFHRGRWTAGCALLAGSLLVKPLLLPLLLVPAVHRRYGALARTLLPAGILLLAAMLLVPGGEHYPAVLRYVAAATDLHGGNAVHNLSLRGWAEAHGLPVAAGAAAACAACILVGVRVTAALRTGPRPSPVWLGTLLLLGTLLAGGIAEVHHLLVVAAGVLLLLALRPAGWPLFAPGIALLALPAAYARLLLGPDAPGQTWFVVAELLLFAALLTGPHPTGITQDVPIAERAGDFGSRDATVPVIVARAARPDR